MNKGAAKLLSDPRWAETKFLVKASDNEQFWLWKEWSKQADSKGKVDWISEGDSKAITVDTIDGKPVVVCFTFVKMKDVVVVFYDAISRLVDWDLVTDWLKSVWKGKWNGDQPAVCGFSNFKDCIKYVLVESSREVGDKKEKKSV
jgi:hypothetical protein